MIRDLILLAALCGIVPLILRAPFVGLLAWLWVSLMNPHEEVHGFLHGAPVNFYIALLTGAAWLASSKRKLAAPNLFTVLLLLFAAWASVSAWFALDRAHALPLWDRAMKTVVLAMALALLADTRARIQAVVWVVAISLGYYAVKGGGFVLLTGGHNHVFGPETSMIQDNNMLGLALVMLLPILNYLRLTSARAVVRWGLVAAVALDLLAILGTYSRGALIALAAAAAAYAVRSRYGLALVLAAAIGAAALPSFLPPSWFERMSTIQAYNQDASFQSRVSAWRTSFNIAEARPLVGGGFAAVEQDAVAQAYRSPGSLTNGRSAHSVYFQVLGDTGFVGLALYLSAIAAAVLNTFRVLSAVRGRPELQWAGQLARMLQVSFVGFLAGGAALSMAYYDGAIALFTVTAALLQTVRRPADVAAPAAAAAPRWKRAEGAPATLQPQQPAA